MITCRNYIIWRWYWWYLTYCIDCNGRMCFTRNWRRTSFDLWVVILKACFWLPETESSSPKNNILRIFCVWDSICAELLPILSLLFPQLLFVDSSESTPATTKLSFLSSTPLLISSWSFCRINREKLSLRIWSPR